MMEKDVEINNFKENFEKKKLSTKNILASRMNEKGEFNLDQELLDFSKEKEITSSVIEFILLNYINDKNINQNHEEIFVLTQEFLKNFEDDANHNFLRSLDDSNLFEKKYFFYFFQDNMSNWNVAFIRELHLLIKNQFIQTNTLNSDPNARPSLCLFTNFQSDDIKDPFFCEIFEALNRFFNQYTLGKYNETFDNVCKYNNIKEDQFIISIEKLNFPSYETPSRMIYNFKQILLNLDQIDVFLQIFDFNLKKYEEIMEEIDEVFNNYKHLNTHNKSTLVLLKPEKIFDNFKEDIFELPPSRKTQYIKFMRLKDISLEENNHEYSTRTEKIISRSSKKSREFKLEIPKKVNISNDNIIVDKLDNPSHDDIHINSLNKGNETFNISHLSYKNDNELEGNLGNNMKTNFSLNSKKILDDISIIKKGVNESILPETNENDDPIDFSEIQRNNNKIISLEIDLKPNKLKNKPLYDNSNFHDSQNSNDEQHNQTQSSNIPKEGHEKLYIKKKLSNCGLNNGVRKTSKIRRVNTSNPVNIAAPRNTSIVNPINYRDKLSVITEDQIEEARLSISPTGKFLRTSNTLRTKSDNVLETEKPFVIDEGVESNVMNVYRTNLEEILVTEPESKPEFEPIENTKKPFKNAKNNSIIITEREVEKVDHSMFSTNIDTKTNRISIPFEANNNPNPEKKNQIPILNLSKINLNSVYGTETIESKVCYLEEQMRKEFHNKRKTKRNEISARIRIETNRILNEESNIMLKKEKLMNIKNLKIIVIRLEVVLE